MTTLHSGHEPESSTARRNLESVGLDTIHHLHNEATSDAFTQSSLYDDKSALARTLPVNATEAPTPRRTSIYDSNIELEAINPHHDKAGAAEPEFSLLPVDRGKNVWLFLFSAFVLEILVWGTAYL